MTVNNNETDASSFSSLLEKLRLNDASLTVVSLMDSSNEKAAKLGNVWRNSTCQVESMRLNLEHLTASVGRNKNSNCDYDALLEALQSCDSLHSVELHSNPHGQVVAERFIKAISNSKTVERIELHHVSLTSHVLKQLLDGAPSKKRVSLLHGRLLAAAAASDDDDMTTTTTTFSPSSSSSLYTVTFSRCRIVTPEAGRQLLAVLKNCKHCKSLRFLATVFGETEQGGADDFFAELQTSSLNVFVKDYEDEFVPLKRDENRTPEDHHRSSDTDSPTIKGEMPTYQLETTVLRLR